MSFENTVRKGEIAHNEQFLLFPQCFLPFQKTLCHFYKIQNCHLQTLSILKNLKFVVLDRVNCLIKCILLVHNCDNLVRIMHFRDALNPLLQEHALCTFPYQVFLQILLCSKLVKASRQNVGLVKNEIIFRWKILGICFQQNKKHLKRTSQVP